MFWALSGFIGVIALLLAFALFQVGRPMPRANNGDSGFDFAKLVGASETASLPPELSRYRARDGAMLSYRFYDSSGDAVLLFVHGSSYHGGGYHALAERLSATGHAKVYLPNLRGHYMSGARRGDIDYIGQLEDDLADLIAFARSRGHGGSLILGGHSSGGGLAIRFAGGAHRAAVDAFALLSPVLPIAPTTRGGDAGGWAVMNMPRFYGLLILNAFGVRGLNGLPVIQFNKPEEYWDGTETLSYSYRLNDSYHPRYEYAKDVAALGDRTLVLIGDDDEANDASAYAPLFAASGVNAEIEVLPGIDHFEIISDPRALSRLESWLATLGPQRRAN